jgi:hypothetical protein
MTSYNLTQNYSEILSVESHSDNTFGNQNRYNKTFKTFQTDGSETIEYRLNSMGFRSDLDYSSYFDFNAKGGGDYILCIGCSHTEGIGVDVNDRWGEVLGKKLGLPALNFGLTSASQMWCQYVYSNIKFTEEYNRMPKWVFTLQPPNRRLTIFGQNRITFFQEFNWKTNADDGSLLYHSIPQNKTWEIIPSYEDTEENGDKNSMWYHSLDMSYKSLCKQEGIINLDWDILGEDYPKSEADNMHFGKEWHHDIAELFYQEVRKTTTII